MTLHDRHRRGPDVRQINPKVAHSCALLRSTVQLFHEVIHGLSVLDFKVRENDESGNRQAAKCNPGYRKRASFGTNAKNSKHYSGNRTNWPRNASGICQGDNPTDKGRNCKLAIERQRGPL